MMVGSSLWKEILTYKYILLLCTSLSKRCACILSHKTYYTVQKRIHFSIQAKKHSPGQKKKT